MLNCVRQCFNKKAYYSCVYQTKQYFPTIFVAALHSRRGFHYDKNVCRPPLDYTKVYTASIENQEEFFAQMAAGIAWFKPWDRVLDVSKAPFQKWFVGGEMNTCYNAVDRHVEAGHGNRLAVIHDSPVTGSKDLISYADLQKQVAKFAGVLSRHGVGKGDRVIVYMPMIPQAIVSMLACARIGAVHTLIFGGFSSKELSVRIEHSKAKLIVSANCGIEPSRTVKYIPIVEEAISMSSHQPSSVIIYNRPELEESELKAGQYCYNEEIEKAPLLDCIPVESNDPLYILYTSGTTGQPKGVVRSNGGHAVVLNWSMKNVYGLDPGEVWWSASDLGWIVGHSYICYAPLLHGNTTVMYEGKPVGTPDSSAFFRILHEHNVTSMFVAPTALRAIRRVDHDAKLSHNYPSPNFRTMFVAGEHCDVETAQWTREKFKAPVLDNWWQTETGWPITCTNVGLNNRLDPPDGSTGLPVPGWNVKVLRPDGSETNDGELGDIVVKSPLPPGFGATLWRDDERYLKYFEKYPGYYDTADSGVRDSEGYIAVMARTDDVINVAGHRLSTSHIEEAIMNDPHVAECAVVGIKDELKGQIPLGFCILNQDTTGADHIMKASIVKCVRDHIGAVAAFKHIVFVPALPKTRSGKIARATLASLADGKPFKIPPTLEDDGVYEPIQAALQSMGFAKTLRS